MERYPARFPWLNITQEEAVNAACAKTWLRSYHDPPGTGKPPPLVEVVYETLHRNSSAGMCAKHLQLSTGLQKKLVASRSARTHAILENKSQLVNGWNAFEASLPLRTLFRKVIRHILSYVFVNPFRIWGNQPVWRTPNELM